MPTTNPTFAQLLEQSSSLGDQADAVNEAIVADILVSAAPIIEKMRQVAEQMSDNISFTGKVKQVLHQIDIGLLKDPMAIAVQAKLAAAQAEATAASADAPEKVS